MTWSWRDGLRYGLLGFPLAFVALPLYVVLPNHYAREFGVPLASLGAVLLGARLFDAFIDPMIGRWADSLYAHSFGAVLRMGAAAAAVLFTGFAALFFPPSLQQQGLLVWACVLLVMTYAAFSALTVMHQAWGAMLGGDEAQRGRIVAWREGPGLLGVLAASVLPSIAGMAVTAGVFALALVVGWMAWSRAPRPGRAPERVRGSLWLPFERRDFRALLAVFMLNGIASAIPATLVLFFVQDRLEAPASIEPAFLGVYFLCAALSIPVWLTVVRRIGLARAWLCGMALAMAVFIWAAWIGSGEFAAFLAVCALSGAALGSDLALPGALLAGVIDRNGDRGQSEGAYFGWWNFATKLNLALAAGLVLPLLGAAGYVPGSRDPHALSALVMAYCLLPCVLKLLAAGVLTAFVIRSPA